MLFAPFPFFALRCTSAAEATPSIPLAGGVIGTGVGNAAEQGKLQELSTQAPRRARQLTMKARNVTTRVKKDSKAAARKTKASARQIKRSARSTANKARRRLKSARR